MPNSTDPERREQRGLADVLADVPIDSLDTPEVEGGLTWRQTILLATTAGLLALPANDEEVHYPARLALKQRVYERVKAHYGDGVPADATDLVLTALGLAEREYAELVERDPVWLSELAVLREIIPQWGADHAYSDELLARNVLWYLNYDGLVETQ